MRRRLAAVVLMALVTSCASERDSNAERPSSVGDAAAGAAASSLDVPGSRAIWPLPEGLEVWVRLPYRLDSVDGLAVESVTLELRGAEAAAVAAFYEALFAREGAPTTRFGGPEALVIDMANPGDGTTGLIQIVEDNGLLVLHQERSGPADAVGVSTTVHAPREIAAPGPNITPEAPPSSIAMVAPDSSTTPPASTAPDVPAPSASPRGPAARQFEGRTVLLDWALVSPTYQPAGGGNDPFFHIHTSSAVDGFVLSFELYTVFGAAWTGETGQFDIGCLDARLDTGICVHYDPDGLGDDGDLGDDFGARGRVLIRRLDAEGYDIDVMGLEFSDGTRFADFTMTGAGS